MHSLAQKDQTISGGFLEPGLRAGKNRGPLIAPLLLAGGRSFPTRVVTQLFSDNGNPFWGGPFFERSSHPTKKGGKLKKGATEQLK